MRFAKRPEVTVLFLALCLFFLLRLYNILGLPIFTDEAIYLRWAQIAKDDATWRFISLTDGKQPLFIWFTMVAMRLVEDPLLAGRLVSVGAGLATALGLFVLGRELFKNTWIGIATSLLYALYPFALVYDRMALYDSLVGTFAVWSLLLSLLLVRMVRLDVALILGMVMGGGVLNKTAGFFGIYLLPLTLFLFDWEKKERMKRFLKWIALAFLAVLLAYGFYSILRLSPFFHIIEEKNALFVYPFHEWIKHPFLFFVGNLIIGERNWLVQYMGISVLALVGLSFLDRIFWKEKVILVLWFFLPFAALALFGRVLYPRFIFFMTLPLLPLASLSLQRIKKLFNRSIFFILVVVAFIPWLRTDYLILTNFARAPIPKADIDQYLTEWPAGGGIKEATAFFRKEAKKGKILIATQGTFGLMPYAFELYLGKNPNVRITSFWPVPDSLPKELQEKSRTTSTYVVFYQPCPICPVAGVVPKAWNVGQVFQYKKLGDEKYLSVYRVNP